MVPRVGFPTAAARRRTHRSPRSRARAASRTLQYDLEAHRGGHIASFGSECHWADELATLNEWVFRVIPIWIALEHGICREVELCGQELVPRGAHQVVDVLTHPRGIVTRHDRLERVRSVRIRDQRRPIVIPRQIVLPRVIGMPNL